MIKKQEMNFYHHRHLQLLPLLIADYLHWVEPQLVEEQAQLGEDIQRVLALVVFVVDLEMEEEILVEKLALLGAVQLQLKRVQEEERPQ
jgi:hypothetical protein